MAIGTTAALLGSAVIGAGASLYGSSKASGAASKAAAQNAQIQQQQYAQTRQDLQPYTQYGYAAGDALQNRLGLNQGGGAGAGAGGGAPNYSAYLAANPDLAAEGARVTASGQFANIGDYLSWHDQNYAGEGRNSYADPSAAQGGSPMINEPTGQTEAEQPWATMERPSFQTPNVGAAPSFGPAPSFGAAPGFYMDPNPTQQYKDELARSTRSLNSRYGATGGYFSGARGEALQENANRLWAADEDRRFARANTLYSQALSQYNQDRSAALSQYNTDRSTGLGQYNTDRSTTLGQFNTDRSVGNQAFDSDRGFGAGRYDTETGNLFNLLGVGANATQALAGYGQQNANNQAANNNALAGAKGNAAIAGANSFNNLLGNTATAYGIYGGGGRYGQPATTGPAIYKNNWAGSNLTGGFA